MAKITLIQSNDKEPIAKIKLKPGTRIEVVEVGIKNEEMKDAQLVAATLCGYGSNYCVAVVEL